MININRVKEVRKRLKLSQSQLADMVGVTPRYIAFIETGDRTPSLKIANLIAEVLGDTVDNIFLTKKCTKCTKRR